MGRFTVIPVVLESEPIMGTESGSRLTRDILPVTSPITSSALPTADQNQTNHAGSIAPISRMNKMDDSASSAANRADMVKVYSSDNEWVEVPQWMLSVR